MATTDPRRWLREVAGEAASLAVERTVDEAHTPPDSVGDAERNQQTSTGGQQIDGSAV